LDSEIIIARSQRDVKCAGTPIRHLSHRLNSIAQVCMATRQLCEKSAPIFLLCPLVEEHILGA